MELTWGMAEVEAKDRISLRKEVAANKERRIYYLYSRIRVPVYSGWAVKD